ncbi:recombinase family protein [Massilia sp. NEAU-DD11]|uniref:Recombinase family protein n=2 Tax=Massilia cellulosiltytica TaxID=2683234 RepID=A0A7X3G658_9BURK|nr:recombinase family protein [Telluria cellulosilytica]
MLGQMRRGETPVVSKLDRLGANAHDIMATIPMLARGGIAVVVLPLGNLDLGSPADKLMLSMLAAVAELERNVLIERTQAGLARAKSEGKTLLRPLKTNSIQRTDIVKKRSQETVSSLARLYSVSLATILGILRTADH